MNEYCISIESIIFETVSCLNQYQNQYKIINDSALNHHRNVYVGGLWYLKWKWWNMAKRCNHTFAIIPGASDPLGLKVFFLIVSVVPDAKLSVPQHLHNCCFIEFHPSIVPRKHLLILLQILKREDGEWISQYTMVGIIHNDIPWEPSAETPLSLSEHLCSLESLCFPLGLL